MISFLPGHIARLLAMGLAVVALSVGCGDGGSGGPDAADSGGVRADADADGVPADADAGGVPDDAAGGDVPADVGTDVAADPCPLLVLGPRDLQLNVFQQLTGLRYPVTPNLDGAAPDALFVELYDSTTPSLPPLAAGTFPLGVAPDDDLATCQHCVWLPVDWDGEAPFGAVFIATAGSLTLTRVNDPLEPVFAGSFSELELREATVDEEGGTTLVQGGRCLHVPATSFDTAPTPGSSCESAEDCGNPLLEVCSPATHTCSAPECADFLSCPEERPLCLSQYRDAFEGGCYGVCDPTAGGGCADGEVCLQLSVNPQDGYCLRSGDGALGAACTPEDTSTACAPGQLCSFDTLTCTRTCAFFSEQPGCQDGAQCNVLGECAPPASAIDVAFGAACGETAALAQGCAPDGAAFRGICFAFREGEPLRCEEACLGDLGCEPEEFCALRFTSGLGICLPDPVCGDGLLGEIDELCDDGNTDSDDGCSGDCQTVEYAPICSAAPPLTAGSAVSGDTQTAWDGFQATCQAGIARVELYRFSPPSRGRLRLTLDSPPFQMLSVRTACADAASETACTWDGSPELTVQVTDDALALTVLVSAFTVLDQGPFTLHAEFVAESCGDGVVAGLEVCDDGNTASDDGCSGDCRAIEYDWYCATAPVLEEGVPAAGDNSDGPFVFSGSCSNDLYGSGPDRLYQYTATAAGTLRVRLEPEGTDLALSVFDGCGAPDIMSELDCSSVYDIEQVEATVTAGQTVTVLVEGFGAEDGGPFTLTAELLP